MFSACVSVARRQSGVLAQSLERNVASSHAVSKRSSHSSPIVDVEGVPKVDVEGRRLLVSADSPLVCL